MIYLADTADLAALKDLYRYFPLEGVTTNPTIIKQSGMAMSQAISSVLELIGDGMIHIQVRSDKAEDILKEAKLYREHFSLGSQYYVKIPVSLEGFKAMSLVKDAGMNVTATAIFTQQQALIAARSGADYVAPYVSRLDNISSHGIDVVRDIARNIHDYKLYTKVLAASFKTVDQIYRVSMNACHSATISPELIYQMVKHPMTDISIDTFSKDAEGVYDIPLT